MRLSWPHLHLWIDMLPSGRMQDNLFPGWLMVAWQSGKDSTERLVTHNVIAGPHVVFWVLCFKSIFAIIAIQGPTIYASISRLFVLMVVSNTMPTWRNTTPGIISPQTSEYGKMPLTWRRVEVDKSTSTIPMKWAFNTSLLSWKAWNMWIFWTLGRMCLFWVSFCWCISCWVGGYNSFKLHSALLDGDLLNQRMSTEIGCIVVLQTCHIYTKLHVLMRNNPGCIDISHWWHWNLGCIVASRWMARSTAVVEHLPWQRSGRCCRWQCSMCTKRNSGLVESFGLEISLFWTSCFFI